MDGKKGRNKKNNEDIIPKGVLKRKNSCLEEDNSIKHDKSKLSKKGSRREEQKNNKQKAILE